MNLATARARGTISCIMIIELESMLRALVDLSGSHVPVR